MTNETTPDAVAMLQWMHACVVHSENHGDVPRIGSDEVLAVLRATQDERARHAEEVASMRDEIEDWEAAAQELSNRLVAQTADRDSLRDQLRRAEGERAAEFLRRTALGGTIVSSAGLTLEQIDIARRAGRMFVTDEGLGFVYVPGPVGLQPYATDGDELREAIGGSIHETMRSASLNSQGGGGR